jgi:hypothetical protein
VLNVFVPEVMLERPRILPIIGELDRIQRKHLLTLQEGVSEAQFREMQEANVQLIVPIEIQDA